MSGTLKSVAQLEATFDAGKVPSATDYQDMFASFVHKSEQQSGVFVFDSGYDRPCDSIFFKYEDGDTTEPNDGDVFDEDPEDSNSARYYVLEVPESAKLVVLVNSYDTHPLSVYKSYQGTFSLKMEIPPCTAIMFARVGDDEWHVWMPVSSVIGGQNSSQI